MPSMPSEGRKLNSYNFSTVGFQLDLNAFFHIAFECMSGLVVAQMIELEGFNFIKRVRLFEARLTVLARGYTLYYSYL